MATLPTAPVVSRALWRDAGIRTRPAPKPGYSVHRGSSSLGPSVWVSVSDADSTNVRHAKALRDQLVELGWEITSNGENSSIFYVTKVPTAKEINAALVCDHCGNPEGRCQAAKDGRSITLITREAFKAGDRW